MKWYAGQNLPKTHAKPTFSEAWFHSRYGLTFGERYFSDPLFRTEQDREARRLLYDCFGDAGIGEKDPKPLPNLEVCGHRFLPGLFGCEIVFQDDQAPTCHHLAVESAAEIAAIPKPDLHTNRWAEEFRRQGAILTSRYGAVDAAINFGGPINGAVTILGNQALLHLSEAPEVMTGFLKTVADVCVESYDALTVAFDPHAAGGRELFIGNCPVMMMSPATYAQVVLPADQHYRRQISRFGLHHCGQMDRYLAAYQTLKPIEFIEVGWGSNVAAVRAAFPDAKLDLMIHIFDLQNLPGSQVRELMLKIVREAAPVSNLRDVWVADIGPEVPDESVLEFVAAVDWAAARGNAAGKAAVH